MAAVGLALLLGTASCTRFTKPPPRPYVSFAHGTSLWHGYPRYDLVLAAGGFTVVAPRQVAPGVPWVWRASGIPLLHGHAPADPLVPFDENTAVVAERYRAMGGDITVIEKPGTAHVPGVDPPAQVIEFLRRCATE
jgi:hypothetical protein